MAIQSGGHGPDETLAVAHPRPKKVGQRDDTSGGDVHIDRLEPFVRVRRAADVLMAGTAKFVKLDDIAANADERVRRIRDMTQNAGVGRVLAIHDGVG